VCASNRVAAHMEMKKVCMELSNSGGYCDYAKVQKSRSVPLKLCWINISLCETLTYIRDLVSAVTLKD